MRRYLLGATLALALTGCATTGTGSKWYAPATWFSSAPAANADKATARVEIAQEAAIKAAQRSAHETAYALAAAPLSRPVTVAVGSNDTAMGLLDQVAGPLSITDASMARDRVAALMSENAAIRAEAEAQRAKDQAGIATISDKLAKAVQESQTANDKLRVAFDRENELANQLRSQKALLWIAGSLSVLFAAGWVYLRFFLGGMPSAIGGLINHAEKGQSLTAADIRQYIDTAFHEKPSVLASVAAAYHKAK